ncbi:MAG: hypothetical protein KC502_04040 [Myxococcales bacterium]|nr:hypothetical protein [Myxococcales bacterium]
MNIRLSRIIPTNRGLLAALATIAVMSAACGQPIEESIDGPLMDTSTGVDTGGKTDTSVGVDTAVKPDVPTGTKCTTDFDCNNELGKTPCSLPRCNEGICAWDFKATGSTCNDPTLTESACEVARCDDKGGCNLMAKPVGTPCDAGKSIGECEIAACDLAKECSVTAKADETACGIGVCGNWCQEGKCGAAPDTAYDDGDPCTKDYCDQNTEIKHDPITAAVDCDDGNPCTGDGTCKEGKCKTSGNESCNDGIACTDDSCDPKTGCVHKAKDTVCEEDGSCFDMACDLAVGCTATTIRNGSACDDDDKCTEGEKCNPKGECVATSNICKCKEDKDCKESTICQPYFCDVKLEECVVDLDKKVVCDKGGDSECGVNTCDVKTGQCGMVALKEGKVCDDGSTCTSKSACKEAACVGEVDKKCDDGNPCTADNCDPLKGCVHPAAPGDCDDGKTCTEEDTCENGGCVGQKKPCDDGVGCTFDSCDPKTGKCINTPGIKTCNDNNPCTVESCDPKTGCKNNVDDKAKCEDDDKCTITACKSGKCVTTAIDKTVEGCGCTSNKECNDNNPCTTDSCVKGDCKFDAAPQDGKACQGGNLCVLNMKCNKGSCSGGTAKVCNDNNPCTNDACSAKTGKCGTTAKADGTVCDADKSLCTQKDSCKKGTCIAGTQKDCSSFNDACNFAICTASTGKCGKKPKKAGETCDDGKFCTDNDKCDSAGKCTAGPAKNCGSAADTCNTGICDETKNQCVKKPKASGTKCNDGQYCTTNEICNGKGTCGSGKARICQSNLNACKAGYCDEKGNKCALKAAPSGTSCNDANLCTQTDKCDTAGVCKGTNPKSCASDQCNTGICDPKSGACGKKPKANGLKCNDANLCTQTDTCQSGACKGTNPKLCKGTACSLGVCDPKTANCGLKPKKDGTLCSDGQACTKPDVCKTGKCLGGPWTCQCKIHTDCNDKNSCTADTCVSGKCYNKITAGTSCSDGNLCTKPDVCNTSGICVGKPVLCNDKKACTADSCSKTTGACVYKILSGFPCSDGKLCTTSDTCTSKGTCVGKTTVCNDGKVCTTDSCNASTGKCQYLINTAPCSDGNACTLKDTCYKGLCKPGVKKNCADSTKCSTDGCNAKTGACTHSPAYENYTCEAGSYSICTSGSCKCRVWTSTYGGSSTDYLFSVARASDLGTVAVGTTYVSGKGYEGYIVRRDKSGKVIWAKTVAASTTTDQLLGVTATKTANTFIAVGYRYLNSTYGYVGWIIRFDINGKILYNTYRIASKTTDRFSGIVHDGAGNMYVSGTTYGVNPGRASGWVVRLNNNGGYVWGKYKIGKVLTASYNYEFYAITYSKGYIYAVGRTNQPKYGAYDGVVTRWSSSGSNVSTWWYGGKGYDVFYAVKPYSSYLWLAGQSQNTSVTTNGYDAWLVKGYYHVPNKIYDRKFGSTGSDYFRGIDNYGSGTVLAGAYRDPKSNRYRGYVVRTGYTGTAAGTYYFGHPSYHTYFYGIEDNASTGYYTMVGQTTQGNQSYTVQSTSTGITSCKSVKVSGPIGDGGKTPAP